MISCRCIAAAANTKKATSDTFMQIHTAVAKCTQPAFAFVEVGREQTHIIVTFHYRAVALSLIPAVQPGASRTAGLSDKGGREKPSRL